ncbi:MAG TPA: DNA internalization-related competence protein ComEC/Rec2, partial [Azospira sp.]|nr:DNA internalization-related competence protein ComEC/Rec2 [Azospira sp.]
MRLNILAFALGLLAVQASAALPASEVALASLALLPLAWLYGRKRLPAARPLLLLACLACGFGWAALRADLRLADELPADWEGRDIHLVGVVAELPQPFAHGERFAFDVEQVLTAGARTPPRIVLSRYSGAAEEAGEAAGTAALRPGQRWQLTVRLKRPHGNANPHAFDYEAWLLERGIRATGYVRARPPAALLDERVAQPGYLLERARDAIRARFLDTLAGEEFAGVLVALTVGDQRAIHGEFWRLFARTGTTHLMSISGLHVTMVAALLAWAAGFLWRRSPRLVLLLPAQRAAVVAGWLGALFYAFLSGFSVPAQRTLYMLTVAALALLSGRRTAASRTLALALAVVLLLDPWAVLAPGFWLSFGAVALLFYVAGERVGERGATTEASGKTAVWPALLARWGAAQWAVSIGSLPLLLLFFQQFSLVSPLANALAIPAISFVVTPLALLAAIVPLPGLLHLDHWLLGWVMDGLAWLAEFPVHAQPVPPLWAVLLALAGVAWLLLPRGFPARWLGLLMLLPALLTPTPRPPAGQATVTVLDVGQGLAVVVQTATRTLLYDTGPLYSAESDAGQRVVLPYLRALGIDRLDALVVTHGDSDHAGGAASVLAALPVERVLSSVAAFADSADFGGEPCRAGQSWTWDGVRFTMLHPEPEQPNGRARVKTNNLSCVLRVEAGGKAVLLTSDIEAVDEAALLA